ncbi:Uncharacterised protein [Mycobacterium tuberculosis]|uniref:Uncharacterized protein n=1 Tax=Mycobacterium tuberculosis TaxID=1773 RepID=A0A0U0QL17_MYCTX|nr:Uncharacterised protein [Mycobacterium tuberculosis]
MPSRRWNRAMRLKNPRLVLQHRRLVDLVNHSARRPVQAVGPSVQSGSEDHHLPDTCVDGGTEVLVEEVGAHRLVVAGNPMHASAELITVEPGQIGVGQPCPGGTRRRHQHLGELVTDQRIGRGRFHGTCRRDPQRGGANAFGDRPGIASGPSRGW